MRLYKEKVSVVRATQWTGEITSDISKLINIGKLEMQNNSLFLIDPRDEDDLIPINLGSYIVQSNNPKGKNLGILSKETFERKYQLW